jgi:bis(5'-nucleosidyl)-tetraphosphatase
MSNIRMCDEYYNKFTTPNVAQQQETNFIPMFFKTIKSSSYSLFNYTKNKYSNYLSKSKTYPPYPSTLSTNSSQSANIPNTPNRLYNDTVFQYVHKQPNASVSIPFDTIYNQNCSVNQQQFLSNIDNIHNNHNNHNNFESSSPTKQPRLKRCGIICVRYIFNVPHLLIVRGKRSHIWSLPKGCINQNETEIECAQRETLEETGLNINITSVCPRVAINHNVYFVVIIDFNPKLKTRDTHEIDKVSWMTLQEIQYLQCNKDLRSILQYPKRKFTFHNALVEPLQLNKLVGDTHKQNDVSVEDDKDIKDEQDSKDEQDEDDLINKIVDIQI